MTKDSRSATVTHEIIVVEAAVPRVSIQPLANEKVDP
jgi:hypothetical protein